MKRINIYSLQMIKEKGTLYDLETKRITSPDSAFRIAEAIFDLSSQPSELFVVLTLTTKNEVAGAHVISKGTLNSSIVHPREVFQPALLNNAASVIAFHNHPSGDLDPSPEDISATKQLVKAGEILGIQFLDHIIIGDGRFKSLKGCGHM